MIWILIFSLHVGYGTGAGSAEFTSQQACEHAKQAIFTEWKSWADAPNAICVPKGDTK